MRNTTLVVIAVLGLSTSARAQRLEVAVENGRLHAVARLLAQVGRKNVVVSGEVKGKVTRVAKGLSFGDSLKAFLGGHEAIRLGTMWIIAPKAVSALLDIARDKLSEDEIEELSALIRNAEERGK